MWLNKRVVTGAVVAALVLTSGTAQARISWSEMNPAQLGASVAQSVWGAAQQIFSPAPAGGAPGVGDAGVPASAENLVDEARAWLRKGEQVIDGMACTYQRRGGEQSS